MPSFPPPKFDFPYDVDDELKALRDYPEQEGKGDRAIPPKTKDRLLVATWNIANLGAQKRREKDYRLIAEIVSWFDVIAIQETKDDLTGLRAIQEQLPDRYEALFSDPGGNNERFAVLYDSKKVTPEEEIGEVTIPPKELRYVKLKGVTRAFEGFDRNPYLVSLGAGDLRFSLVNVHLYFGGGDSDHDGIDRRCLEAYALARWADLRHKNDEAYSNDVLALGDFNLPLLDPEDPVYKALTKRGLHLPPHSTAVGGSNLNDDASYDQMAVFPGTIEKAIERSGVFDFDGAVFRGLWGDTKAAQKKFRSYVKYYLSDHRPLWASLRI